MTPYESALAKKLTQATDLSQRLSNWGRQTDQEVFSEEIILQESIQRLESCHHRFDDQVQRYQQLSDERRQLVLGSDDSIKPLTERLWEDINYQFRGGTVANDLLKILCQKIGRLPLPDFPVRRRTPLLAKEVCLYEDSYRLLGQYFSWLVDLLQIVNFKPLRPTHCLNELTEKVRQYILLTQQIGQEADMLRMTQLTKTELYRQLNQAMSMARGRLLIYKRDRQRSTRLEKF